MLQNVSVSVVALMVGLTSLGCSAEDDKGTGSGTLALTSPMVQDGVAMPDAYTCVGKDFPYSGMPPVDHLSPELNWTAGPEGTLSYAVVFKDVTLTAGDPPMDERGFHWAIYNIPPSVLSLPSGLASGNPIAAIPGAKQYSAPPFNHGYIGPCPSWGVAPGSPLLGMDPAPTVKTDSYTFTVFAMPVATIAEPAMRAAPAAGGPAVSYVRDLDNHFIATSIASGQIATTSSAQPAMFVPPPMPVPSAAPSAAPSGP